jgi:hypothetical protein
LLPGAYAAGTPVGRTPVEGVIGPDCCPPSGRKLGGAPTAPDIDVDGDGGVGVGAAGPDAPRYPYAPGGGPIPAEGAPGLVPYPPLEGVEGVLYPLL